MSRVLPPGPPSAPLRSLWRFSRDPLSHLTRIGRDHGPISSFLIGRVRIFFLNDPELVKELLVVKHRSFEKDRGIKVAKKLLGEGLLSSEGDFHKRQRRLSAPAFHRERIAAYGDQMVEYALRTRDRWRDGATVNAVAEMNRLTLGIVGKTLFGADVDGEAAELGRALSDALEMITILRLGFSNILDKLPLPGTRRWQVARERLDQTMYRMIEERRRSGQDNGDLLSMLLLATDTEGDGTGMNDLQLRDEAMTIFLAGHETTANALSWTFFLLGQHPEVEAKLHAEIDSVLDGRTPTGDDVRRLPFTESVIAESMRLFPPAWGVGRTATEDVELGGFQLKKGENALVSQWVMHRDERFFPDPLRFHPDRWNPAMKAALPKFAYFPFGGGPRVCIGENFAWMEAILVLATLAQEWRLRLIPGQHIVPQPRITLRPNPGIQVRLERRQKGRARASA
jgi:cytochrome P450